MNSKVLKLCFINLLVTINCTDERGQLKDCVYLEREMVEDGCTDRVVYAVHLITFIANEGYFGS